MRLRHGARWLMAHLLAATGAVWWAKRQLRRRGAVVVLMFHRVLDDAQLSETHSLPGMVLRVSTFEKMAAYCRNRYETADLGSAQFGSQYTGLRLAFTFDDGWIDTYEHAFPIFTKLGLPMTVFVCPGFVGATLPFWPERIAASMKAAHHARDIEATIERLKDNPCASRVCMASGLTSEIDRTVTWEQLREMDAAGVTIGSHTYSHPILTIASTPEVRLELTNSHDDLERRLHRSCRLLAYPNGNHSPLVRRLAEEAGFQFAFTTARGAWNQNCDPRAVPRANICEDNVVGPRGLFSPAMFEYSVFWNGWRASCEMR
jgi:peptidoglycan/xylan/chitin deacetylase (PgdA/CDA1 family)